MRVLVLDSALARRTAAVVVDDAVIAERSDGEGAQRNATALASMAQEVLRQAGGAIDLVAVTVGPGSFTGIRAGLALGHGFALGRGIPIVGVSVGEAIEAAFPRLGRRTLWVVTGGRRGFVFLERNGAVTSMALSELPMPSGKTAIAGPAARDIAARLAARDADVMLTDARFPRPGHIARVAARRVSGGLSPRDAVPLYVDPPEARPPATAPRPPPDAASHPASRPIGR
jgi:tRNA threonylcarbamoyladenosine biosynthesis protein TsaB